MLNPLYLALVSIGDTPIAGGIVVMSAAFLAGTRNIRVALVLVLAVAAAAAAAGLLKALFLGCDIVLWDIQVRMPSGHAALTSSALGTLGLLFGSQFTGWWRRLVYGLFAAAEAGLAVLIVWTGFHSAYEVLFGLFIGLLAVGGAYLLLKQLPRPKIDLRGFGAVAATAVVLLIGTRPPERDMATWLASQVQTQTPVCRLLAATQVARVALVSPAEAAWSWPVSADGNTDPNPQPFVVERHTRRGAGRIQYVPPSAIQYFAN